MGGKAIAAAIDLGDNQRDAFACRSVQGALGKRAVEVEVAFLGRQPLGHRHVLVGVLYVTCIGVP